MPYSVRLQLIAGLRTLGAPALLAVLAPWLHAGQVAITEILPLPAGDAPEFIEITNLTATPLDTEGWTLRGAGSFDFPAFSSASPRPSSSARSNG